MFSLFGCVDCVWWMRESELSLVRTVLGFAPQRPEFPSPASRCCFIFLVSFHGIFSIVENF